MFVKKLLERGENVGNQDVSINIFEKVNRGGKILEIKET